MSMGYRLIQGPRREWVAQFELDEGDCEAVAAMLDSRDEWGPELLRAAAEIREREAAVRDGPGVSIVVVDRGAPR